MGNRVVTQSRVLQGGEACAYMGRCSLKADMDHLCHNLYPLSVLEVSSPSGDRYPPLVERRT